MITFKKGTRGSNNKYAGTPVILVDSKPEDGKAAGFSLTRDAVNLLELELTGKEYLGFTIADQRLFCVVGEKKELAHPLRVGKSYITTDDGARVVRGNLKPTWEYVSQHPAVGENGAELKLIKLSDAEADVNADVFELVALMPEADNSPEAEVEAEEADWADAEVVTQDTTPDFGDF